MIRIGVLNNLRSGRGQVRVESALSLLRSHPDVLHVETASASLVPEALADFEREGVELLVVNGGDGTLQRLLTELLSRDEGSWLPAIAPIRGGRTNVSAIDLGAHRDPVRSLADLIAAGRAGELKDRAVERAVLRVDLGPEDGVHYGIFFGAGMLHRAVQLTPRYFPEGRAQGLFGAAAVTGTLLGRAALGRLGGVMKADKMRAAFDGEPRPPREYRLVMATTAERLFFGMRPFWGSGPGPVRTTLMAADAWRMTRAAPGILRGRPAPWVGPDCGYESHNSDHVEFQLDCGTTLDGELYAERPDRTIELRGDRRIRFVRG